MSCEAHTGELEDFLALQHFAHGCARVFSADRWALTGEAGVFTDPFYSPGRTSSRWAMTASPTSSRATFGRRRLDARRIVQPTYLRLFDAFIRLYEGSTRSWGMRR